MSLILNPEENKEATKLIFISRDFARANNQNWTIDHLVFTLLHTNLAANTSIVPISKYITISKILVVGHPKVKSDYTFIPHDIKRYISSLTKLTISNLVKNIYTLPNYSTLGFAVTTEGDDILKDISDLGYDMTTKITDPVIGREEEIQRLISILGRKTKNNPVLIGEAGVGKTAIVEGLAQKISKGEVPHHLRRPLISITTGNLVAGTSYRGELEEKIKKLIKIAKQHKAIIFIDEIHSIMSAGSTSSSNIGVSDLLKPELARGDLSIIGATTTREYKLIEKDPAMERRFQPIIVKAPDIEGAISMITKLKVKYEEHHKVIITEEAVTAAVKLSEQYIINRNLPDKAIDLLDETASNFPPATFKISREFDKLRDSLENQEFESKIFESYGNWTWSNMIKYKTIPEIQRKIEKLLADRTIGEDEIRETVGKITGFPIIVTEDEATKVLHLEDHLKEKIIGQDLAVENVTRAILKSKAGLASTKRPIGAFLFMGPTGCGKTELALALTRELFGTEENLLRLDMSEYMEAHSVSKLIGTSPGYVGYGDSPILVDFVRKRKNCVVLLDEAEKSFPTIFNILLGVLDHGRLTSGNGTIVDFTNTIIILTSNISKDALKVFFRPEFLNRLDDIIYFNPLEVDVVRKVILNVSGELFKPLEEKGISTILKPNAIDKILKEGYSSEYGARSVRRYIERHIIGTISILLLKGKITESEIEIDVRDDQFIFLQ